MRVSKVLLGSLLTLLISGTAMAGPWTGDTTTETITVTGKRPDTTTKDFWVEDAYTQFQMVDPRFAKGLMIWNNSTDATGKGATVPPPKFIEGFAARGWNVIRVQRNWRLGTLDSARTYSEMTIDRSVIIKAISAEIHQAEIDGYRRVIVAGEGVGGALAMEAAEANPNLYGVIALAPNIGFVPGSGMAGGANRRFGGLTDISDGLNSMNAEWTAGALQKFRPQRAIVVFPAHDEQVPGLERGKDASSILAARSDLSYLLVDETKGIVGHNGAYDPAFLSIAICAEGLMDPEFHPKPGQINCGRDEVPTVLSEMGVTPSPGRAWFGYSNTGIEAYFELPADGNGMVTLATGRGALWNQPQSVRQFSAIRTTDSVTFKLDGQLMAAGVWKDGLLRMTLEAQDGTRSAIQMSPVN